MKIALLIVATGKYFQFVEQLLDSAEKHFLTGHEVKYIVFSDIAFTEENMRLIEKFPFKITFVKTPHELWPYSTMNRYKHYSAWFSQNKQFDYVYAIDADAKFAGTVGDEILKPLVGVIHCGHVLHYPEQFPEGTRDWKHYYGGGFVGGALSHFSELCLQVWNGLDDKILNHNLPKWHDEYMLNYFLNTPVYQSIVSTLDCSYHYPLWKDGKLLPHIKQEWEEAGLNFEPKICFLHKDHQELRT